MALFWEFFLFELKFRLKSISTYVYFALWFFLSFLSIAAEDFINVGNDKVLLNGPYSTTLLYILFTLFGIIVIAAIFGTSILRDFQRDTYQIIFAKPVTKFAYLGGRWAGSFVITVLCFSGLIFGEAAGTLAPWADHTRIASGHFWWYLQPFLSFTVIQIFFLGSLFFCVAGLTRKLFIVYLQGVVVFMAYLIANAVFQATRSLEHFWSAIFDPAGLRLFDSITRYWTVVEKNRLLLSWNGIFLYNRLIWASVGALALIIVYALFPLSVEALTAVSQGRRAAKARESDSEEARPIRSLVPVRLPSIHQVFGPRTTFAQFASLTQLRISNILHELLFWCILSVMVVFAIINGHFAGRMDETNVYPVTFLMVQAVEGSAMLFFLIIATLYAGELIWRERDTHFDGIHDALPMRASTDWLSKLAALVFVELFLLTVVLLCGVLMQTVAGYYHYELLQYFKELYLITFPGVLIFALLALFLQTMLSNKFIAHGLVIGIFVLNIVLFNFGWENTLYLFGNTPPYTYSDMNGYGHFVPGLFWSLTYWLSIAALLGVISIVFALRGPEDTWGSRLRLARQRAPRFVPAAVVLVLIAIGSGSWYFYNTHVLNEYLNAKARRDIQADYEKSFKKYEGIPQPKIIAVDAAIDIFPERRSFSGTGHFVLQNKTAVPISQIHVVNSEQSVSNVQFDRPFHVVSSSPRALYTIYALDQPMEPGEKMNMNFNVGYESHGFKDGNERPELAYSGTFFDVSYFPSIGYDAGGELVDPRRRRDEHLGPVSELPHRGDPVGSVTNLFTQDSDWISYRTVVSTADDQIALAPGYPQREWHQNGRHYYEYNMGDVKTLDFYAYVSARYNVKRDTYPGADGNINIEVYSTPAHPYDVNDMIAATKAGLGYYEKNFSPFQYEQFRILEFPRYRTFAQSFPNTVPYAEFGFIARVVKPDDIDFTYFVTAHELAHQWWGHQLIGGRVEDFCLGVLRNNPASCVQQHLNFWDYKDGWRSEITVNGETAPLWKYVVKAAYNARLDLSAQVRFQQGGGTATDTGLVMKPHIPLETVNQFTGFTYSAACTEVEIDVLTGETTVLRADVLYDMGTSLNPAIDIGQVEGAFIQGLRYVLSEDVVYQPDGPNKGVLNSDNTWRYKLPASTSIPIEFDVDLFPRSDYPVQIPENPYDLYSSKEVGEPPLVLAITAFFAVKHAVLAARRDRGHDEWYYLEAPATVQRIQQACLVDGADLTVSAPDRPQAKPASAG